MVRRWCSSRTLWGRRTCSTSSAGSKQGAGMDRGSRISLCFHRRRLPRKCEGLRVSSHGRDDRVHWIGRRVRRDAREARRPRKDVGGRAHADVGVRASAPAARRHELLVDERHVSDDREAVARRLGGAAARRPVEQRRAGVT